MFADRKQASRIRHHNFPASRIGFNCFHCVCVLIVSGDNMRPHQTDRRGIRFNLIDSICALKLLNPGSEQSLYTQFEFFPQKGFQKRVQFPVNSTEWRARKWWQVSHVGKQLVLQDFCLQFFFVYNWLLSNKRRSAL